MNFGALPGGRGKAVDLCRVTRPPEGRQAHNTRGHRVPAAPAPPAPPISVKMISRGEAVDLAPGVLQKGWALVVLPNQVLEFQGAKTATAANGGKLPVGCPAWHDRAVVVPVVPVARPDRVPPPANPATHVRLKGCRTFWASSGPRSFCGP
jgi:hypothetical protein